MTNKRTIESDECEVSSEVINSTQSEDMENQNNNTKSASDSKRRKVNKESNESTSQNSKNDGESLETPKFADTKKKQPAEKAKQKKSVKPKVNTSGSKGNIKNILKEFLLTKVRPYPLTELITTFKKEGTKVDITNALNELTDDSVLIRKEYGKTILYLGFKQQSNMGEDEIEKLKKECNLLKSENDKYNNEIRKYKDLLNTLCAYGTNEEIDSTIKKIHEEINENKARIGDLSGGKIKVEKKDMEIVDKELTKLKKILRERRDIYKNILGCMMDNSGMKKSDLLEEVGIDEDL